MEQNWEGWLATDEKILGKGSSQRKVEGRGNGNKTSGTKAIGKGGREGRTRVGQRGRWYVEVSAKRC